MGLRLFEHKTLKIQFFDEKDQEKEVDGMIQLNNSNFTLFESVKSKVFNSSSHCFLFERKEQGFELKADYCIGLDWLGNTGRYLYVEPKINKGLKDVPPGLFETAIPADLANLLESPSRKLSKL